jgi:hypothetical protein
MPYLVRRNYVQEPLHHAISRSCILNWLVDVSVTNIETCSENSLEIILRKSIKQIRWCQKYIVRPYIMPPCCRK